MIVLEEFDIDRRDNNCIITKISKCKPFVINARAKLAHRPKKSVLIKLGDREPHTAVIYWCGNQANGIRNIDFSESTEGRLMCFKCEQMALEAGKPSSTELAGEHVCTGQVLAVKDCNKC